jgi:3-oxoacyl-[acyl-carrier-protein] synthase III
MNPRSPLRHVAITGWGSYVPPTVLSNHDLEQVTDTSDEWIATRTGIKERRITHVENSDMAAVAGLRALAAAGRTAADVDLVVVATCTPDRLIPSAASVVQHKMGAVDAGAFDVNAACSGFIYALSVGTAMVRTGSARRVVVIGSEKLSPWLDFDDRTTAVLFGDGAGAVVLEATDDDVGIVSLSLGSDGSVADILTVTGTGSEHAPDPMGRSKVTMDGQEVFRRAVTAMGAAAEQVVSEAGIDLDDIDLLIPHQANSRIIDATAKRLGVPAGKVFTNIASYGNTSAASIPIALCEALEGGRIPPGGNVVLVAFGGGLTWAAAVVRWGDRVVPLAEADVHLPATTASALDLMARHQHGGIR